MTRIHPVLLALGSGLLFTLSWPDFGSVNILLFIAFCPLLYIQHLYQDHERKGMVIMGSAYLAFFTWNLITTYWLLCVEGSPMTIFFSGIAPSVLNSLIMLLPFWLFHRTKKKMGPRIGYMSFVLYWLAMEFFHLQWDLTWTWLEIGNAFSAHPWIVQWYEYTGVHGGTLWVLVANVVVFNGFLAWQQSGKIEPKGLRLTGALLIIPVLFSLLIYWTTEEKGDAAEVVVVQPNIDPYNEKFTIHYFEQLEGMLQQADSIKTPATELFVFPETALQEPTSQWLDELGNVHLTGLWENTIDSSHSLRYLREYLFKNPKLNIIAGVASDSLYPEGTPPTPTARKFGVRNLYYDSFNTGLLITTDTTEIYHKSKLVPAVERLPFVTVMRPILGDAALDFGGTSGGLGIQDYRSVFRCKNSRIAAAPVICYESIYGEFVGDYVKAGANLITIITNDGWWQNTPGHKHHLAYARLRAIEHRRDIARSANTGISAFIDQRGEILQETRYWEKAALRGTVHLNTEMTFYTQYGDYIGRAALWTSVALLLWVTFMQRFFTDRREWAEIP